MIKITNYKLIKNHLSSKPSNSTFYKWGNGKRGANSYFQTSSHLSGVGAAYWGKTHRLSRPTILYKRPFSLADFPIPSNIPFFSFPSLLAFSVIYVFLSQLTIANHSVLTLHKVVCWRLFLYWLLLFYSLMLVFLAYSIRRKVWKSDKILLL